jgi:hypothetical protein
MYKEYSVIDAHCDTLLNVIGSNGIAGIGGAWISSTEMKSPISTSQAPGGGVRCQFFALFVEDSELPRAKRQASRLLDEFDFLCERSKESLFPLREVSDLDGAVRGTAWRRCFR